MSTRCFTLINEKQVYLAPGIRHIAANDYSELVSSKELLQQVKEDAKAYKEEVIQECAALKEQAEQEGFEAGYAKWTEQLAQLEQEILQAHEKVQEVALPLALEAAKKIVGREMQQSPESVVDIVATTLKTVAQHKRIKIYCAKADQQLLEEHKADLSKLFESLESISVRPRDDIEEGGCVIETEVGIINAQLSNRWEALEAAFEKLTQEGMPSTGDES